MTDLTIDGEIFRVEVEGDPSRPAVLLSCSLGTDLSLFDAQMPALLEHFRIVRYDPRGHGRSTTQGAPYSLARLGADALAILDALDIEQAHVVGISMGGAVAQWLLVNAPERIGRAVLANTAARLGTPDVWNARIATVLSEGMEALASATMERWFSDPFRAADPKSVARIETVFRATSAQGYAGGCAALRDMDLREAIRTVEAPVLILTGRDDPVTSAAEIDAMTGAIAGAQHVALDCRHISNIEAQAAFDAAVVGFLTARRPAARRRDARKGAPTRRRARATSARSPLKARKAAPAPARRAPTARKTATRNAPAKPAKRHAVAKATPKKSVKTATGRTAVAKAGARTPVAKKAVTKKAVIKKATAKKTIAKKPITKKPAAKKVAAKKVAAKKVAPKKVAKKGLVRKPATRRRPSRSPRRPGRKR